MRKILARDSLGLFLAETVTWTLGMFAPFFKVWKGESHGPKGEKSEREEILKSTSFLTQKVLKDEWA